MMISEEEKKIYFSMLAKLYITASASSDVHRLRTVHELVQEAIENKVAGDATSRNTLTKLHTLLSKIVQETAGTGAGEGEGKGKEDEGLRSEIAETVARDAEGEEESVVQGGEDEETVVLPGGEETVIENGVDDTRYEPDAEGTVFGDRDRDEGIDEEDEDEDDGDTIVVGYGKEVGSADGLDGSGVDTCLDD